MAELYTKLFHSEIFHSEDGSSWFFVVLKKNILIDKNTIISKEHYDNMIAMKLFPQNEEE